MTDHHWMDRLSEYLDGDLDARERVGLEAHLETCAGCRAVLADLRSIVADAAGLTDVEPERDLWPGIEGRLAERRSPVDGVAVADEAMVIPIADRRGRVMLTLGQLAAAAIALVLFSAGGVWMALATADRPAVAAVGMSSDPIARVAPVSLTASYRQAVSELEAEFQSRRGELDPETILVVERNLAIIDEAIGEASTALAADPASGFLNSHLADAMRRKVELLRTATRIERRES